ncbi:MAG: amidohydrolase family protein [Holophagales bacterium]|nr:amidohydrolase family protein [Holophagales bacterium]MXX61177.1 amidohydrolase family protein [Holophagales bacterium]MYC11657.1 amidohydrolase family protein [Holophagales bacterium]MYD22125.1 amidohydrolase family protein [Holophagales bacterium]MYI32812.1 amidohydrolase family protein [Holophagales bacterium]
MIGASGRIVAMGVLALALAAFAQPAAAQTLAIEGGTVHPVSGAAYTGTVVVRDGVIEAAGPSVAAPQGAQVIDARGLHVYPGLFNAWGALGLTEIGSISATQDQAELGDTPHLLAIEAVHPASEIIPVTRENGITHALTAPSGGPWAGQASVILLDGWTVEEMEVEKSVGVVLEWPSLATREFDFSTFSVREKKFSEAKRDYDRTVDELADWIEASRQYDHARSNAGSGTAVEQDHALEAVARVARGELPLLVVADRARAIRDAVAFAEEHGLRLVVASGRDAAKEADLLAEKKVPVILNSVQALPVEEDDPYDGPFAAPGELHRAGVPIAFGTFDASNARALPYEAATAVAYGLEAEAALRALTLGAAEILGLDDRLGSIDAGKWANLIVADGDPLEVRTTVRHVIVRGRDVDLSNRHSRSYELYSGRPAPP